MKLQLPLHLRCALRDFSEQGRYTVCKGLSYILVRQGLPLYSVGLPRLFFQDVSCRLSGGGRSTVLHDAPKFWHERPTLVGTSQLKFRIVDSLPFAQHHWFLSRIPDNYALEFEAYSCSKHKLSSNFSHNMHTLFSGIHSPTRLSSYRLQVFSSQPGQTYIWST